MTGQKGFSLIELLVVAALLVVTVSITIPLLLQSQTNLPIQQAISSILVRWLF